MQIIFIRGALNKMLTLHFEAGEYFARISLSERPRVLDAGFVFDETKKRWSTKDARRAFRLIEHADEDCAMKLKSELRIGPMKPVDQIIYPKHLKPFEHQIKGVEWVTSRFASYLAFEAGTGKTIIACLCMNSRMGRALVICPAFLKLNWVKEIETWSVYPFKIQVLNRLEDKVDPTAEIIICPDSIISSEPLRAGLEGLRFSFIFIDEAHKFKTPDAKRTKSIVGYSYRKGNKTYLCTGLHKYAQHVVCFSGTPMPNRTAELYTLISHFAPHVFNYADFHTYALQFCDAYENQFGWDYTGASNLEQLHELLTKDYMLFQDLDSCVDLPAKLPDKIIYLDQPNKKLVTDHMKMLSQITLSELLQIGIDESNDYDENSILGAVARLRRQTGEAKVDEAIPIIRSMLAEGHEVVVFAHHKSVITKLFVGLETYKPFVITGETSNKKRHESVEQFQTDKTRKLLIANIQAAGVGITLTKACKVVFVEFSFVPAENEQAKSRLRRIGQTRAVQASFIVWPDSIDHLVINAHLRKQQIIERVIR